MEQIRRLGPYFRFAAELLRYGREPLTLPRARQQVSDKLAHREAALAALIERQAYGPEPGPYRALLDAAGWTKAAVLARLGQIGVDDTLRELADSGVYITLEEFKGRRPVVRGSRQFVFAESDFDNRYLAYSVEVRSGGTRSAGTSVPITLDFSAALAADTAVMLEQWRLWDHAQAIWLPMGGAAAVAALIYAKLGRPPLRWFSQIRGRDLDLLERWTPYLLSGVTRLGGVRVPVPEFAPPDAAGDIARWMAGQAAARRPVCLTTYASSAVRVAAAATAAGVDLAGCAFITIGEPMTDAKRRVIEGSGARLVVRYAMTEAGIIGYACCRPRASDDLHVLETNLAVIAQEVRIGGEDTVPALLFTSLLPVAPKVLFNVQSGDYALMSRQPCGCGFEQAGYGLHVSGIRSFEKLTGEGVTFATTNLLHVLEDLLPSKFGGQPTDYQVTEEESADGIPQLVLVVSPTIGPVDEGAVKDTFLRHLGSSSNARRTSVIWQQAGTLAIRRALPQVTKKGKVQPFHLDPRGSGIRRDRVP
jgi:hypothetical protein